MEQSVFNIPDFERQLENDSEWLNDLLELHSISEFTISPSSMKELIKDGVRDEIVRLGKSDYISNFLGVLGIVVSLFVDCIGVIWKWVIVAILLLLLVGHCFFRKIYKKGLLDDVVNTIYDNVYFMQNYGMKKTEILEKVNRKVKIQRDSLKQRGRILKGFSEKLNRPKNPFKKMFR